MDYQVDYPHKQSNSADFAFKDDVCVALLAPDGEITAPSYQRIPITKEQARASARLRVHVQPEWGVVNRWQVWDKFPGRKCLAEGGFTDGQSVMPGDTVILSLFGLNETAAPTSAFAPDPSARRFGRVCVLTGAIVILTVLSLIGERALLAIYHADHPAITILGSLGLIYAVGLIVISVIRYLEGIE